MILRPGDAPETFVFAPHRDQACPQRFYDLGSESIVEWHEPGVREGERKFRSLCSLQDRIEHEPALPPSLFIFHCGRCGSTLLGRLLEVDTANRVWLEPNALLQFFEANEGRLDNPEARATFRALVGSYGLSPQAGERRLMIKLASQNVRYAEFIRVCFPTVEFVYLFRNPFEVIASNLRTMPAFLEPSNRATLVNSFGHLDRSADDYSPAEWCAWYLERNLRCALNYAHLFASATDYADFRLGYREIFDRWSDSAQSREEESAFATTLARHTKRSGELYSRQSDAAVRFPALTRIDASEFKELYQKWCRQSTAY